MTRPAIKYVGVDVWEVYDGVRVMENGWVELEEITGAESDVYAIPPHRVKAVRYGHDHH